MPATYGTPIDLLAQEGLYVGALYTFIEHYPTATVDSPATLKIEGGTGVIRHGDRVRIQTTEPAAGAYNVLGAWSTPSLYYYTPGSQDQVWIVRKRDSRTAEVNFGEEITFVSVGHAGQYLQPYWSVVWNSVHLTTRGGDPYYWTARAARG